METVEKWIRTCQECFNKQEAKQPRADKELPDTYLNAKCRRCKSEALDYGSFQVWPEVQHG